MTDVEFLCGWMEKKPELPKDCFERAFMGEEIGDWWLLTTTGYESGDEPIIVHRNITLNETHLIEAKLTDEQWGVYGLALAEAMQAPERHFARKLIHADAAAKITALADTLDPAREVRGSK